MAIIADVSRLLCLHTDVTKISLLLAITRVDSEQKRLTACVKIQANNLTMSTIMHEVEDESKYYLPCCALGITRCD